MRADEAVGAAVHAAVGNGLVTAGAYALRVGENGVVVLPAAGALARVVRDEDQIGAVRNELAIAQWLDSQGVSVTRPLVTEPVAIDNYVVSFWEFLGVSRLGDSGLAFASAAFPPFAGVGIAARGGALCPF